MRIAFTTLGCKINQYETDRLRRDLAARGNTIVPFEADADVYIINTCSVTAKSDYQCRQVIRSAIRRSRDARVVVTGCYSSTRPEEVRAIDGVALVVPNADKASIPHLVMKSAYGREGDSCSCPDDAAPGPFGQVATGRSARTRGFLKIQDGCNNNCTYCIVPAARGRSRSESPDRVASEFDSLVQAGCPEIVLTGIHIGTYGLDLIPSTNLTDLLDRLLSRRRSSRLRLSSIEANEITNSMIGFLGKGLCRHLHIPLQSGDDSILASMRRSYTSAFYRELLFAISDRVPGIALGADIIVGFPGEGEREFQNTLSLVQESPLSHLHVFSYSVRPGTPAAAMKNQVSETVKKQRSEILRTLGVRKNLEYRKQFLKSELTVVMEDKPDAHSGLLSGLTDNYIRIGVQGAAEADIGRQVRVRLESVSGQGNAGVIL